MGDLDPADRPRWTRTNGFAALCFAVLLGFLLTYLLFLPETFHRLRDGFFLGILPVFTTAVMLACALSMVVDSKRNEPFHALAGLYTLNWSMIGLVISALASIYLYFLFVRWIGYFLATMLYLPAFMYVLGIRSFLPLAIASVVITLFVLATFSLLGFHLPGGRIFD